MLLLSLIGEQPIPNLLPLWQYRDFSHTQFAATGTTWGVAQQLESAIQVDPALKRMQVLPILRLEAYDLDQARRALNAALHQHLENGLRSAINLTGGTKLMSLAALQAAFGTGIPLIYVSTETRQMIWMGSDGSEQRREPIAVKITVAQYLRAHGLEVVFKPGDPARVGSLLEEKVYRKAYASRLFDDVQRNIHIRRQSHQGQVENELDIAVTRNGRLAVCSCKSGEALRKTRQANIFLYELASLSRREAAGIYCGKVLATDQKRLPDAVRQRAASMDIHLVDGSQFEEIADKLAATIR